MIKAECYVCHRTDGVLASVFAPGTWYMCDDCIKAEEIKTNAVAVFFFAGGIKFVSKEDFDKLQKNND